MPCRDRGWQTCTLGQGPSPQTAAVGEQGAGAEGCGHGTTRVTGTREHSDPGSEPVSRTESAPHRQEDARQTQVHKARARPTGSAQEQRPGDREDPTPRDGRGPGPQRAVQATGHCCPQGASSALAGQNREQENATRWGDSSADGGKERRHGSIRSARRLQLGQDQAPGSLHCAQTLPRNRQTDRWTDPTGT